MELTWECLSSAWYLLNMTIDNHLIYILYAINKYQYKFLPIRKRCLPNNWSQDAFMTLFNSILNRCNTLLIPFPGWSGGKASQSCNINDFNDWFDKSTTMQADDFSYFCVNRFCTLLGVNWPLIHIWNDHLIMTCPCLCQYYFGIIDLWCQ